MRRFGGWSLRARLVALLLATLIPLAGVGGYWIAWEVRQKRAGVQREAREVAEHLADHVGHLVAVVHEMLAVLARSLAVQTRDRREAERLFRDLLATSPHLENIGLLEPDGRVVVTAVLLPPGGPVSFANREWFDRVVRSGQPTVGGFYLGRITGKPVAHVAHPMLDREGRVTAVFFADLRLAARSRAVTAGQPGPSLVWAIVDDKGTVLLHSNPEPPIGKPLGPLSGMLVGEATVPGTSWRAVAGIPEAAITSWVRQHLLLFALPALLIFLLAAGIGFWIAYGTWRPLEELAAAVRRIGAGETGVALPVESGGEIGEVTRAFQETLTALTRRRQELSTLLQATQALAASLDLAQSLQAIVRQASAISGARAVRLFLLEGEPPVLRWRTGVGVPLEDEQHIVIPVGESFSGQVAATGKPLAVPDCRGDPRIRYSHYIMKHGLISYLGLPIKSEGRVVGVLIFNTEAPRSYSEAEISFLSAFAAQAAIAIENARLHSAAVRRSEELGALLRATHTVMAGLDLQGMLDRIVAEAAQISGCPHVKVLLVDQTAEVLRVGTLRGTAMPLGFKLPLGTGLSGLVAKTGQPMFSEDAPNDPRNLFAQRDRELGIVTYLGLPIKIGDEVLGVLTFNTTVPRRYSPEELAYLSAFADQAAIALENARLYDEIRQHAAKLEDRVRERTAELEEALRVKAQFLANMSHELRTPLNFILGFTQLLQQGTGGALTPKQVQYVDHIQKGGKWLLGLVTDMLDLSLVETAKRGLDLEPVLLQPIVEEVLNLVRVQAAQKGLRVSTALDPRLLFVVADRAKLTQILANLIGNAVKFTPDGGHITLRAYQKAESTKQKAGDEQQAADASVLPSAGCLLPSVVIEVEDTGIGIKPEDLERIFRGFEQVDSSDTRKYGGAGLGLVLVRTLVELHGGRVWAESEGPDRGARFVVRLPLLEAPRPKRILVVEDEAVVLEVLCDVLVRAGFAVEQAHDGAEALERLVAAQPDLLVLDIGLPDMDGWEVLKRLRGEERTRDLPVLVLTGLTHVRADQALALGADEFLGKPVSARVLVETVARLLARPAA